MFCCLVGSAVFIWIDVEPAQESVYLSPAYAQILRDQRDLSAVRSEARKEKPSAASANGQKFPLCSGCLEMRNRMGVYMVPRHQSLYLPPV